MKVPVRPEASCCSTCRDVIADDMLATPAGRNGLPITGCHGGLMPASPRIRGPVRSKFRRPSPRYLTDRWGGPATGISR